MKWVDSMLAWFRAPKVEEAAGDELQALASASAQPPPPPQLVEEGPPPPPPPVVYAALRLYGPFTGLYTYEPPVPYIKIDGVNLWEAAQRTYGGLDWNTVPKPWLEALEMGSQTITLPWEQVKAFLKDA